MTFKLKCEYCPEMLTRNRYRARNVCEKCKKINSKYNHMRLVLKKDITDLKELTKAYNEYIEERRSKYIRVVTKKRAPKVKPKDTFKERHIPITSKCVYRDGKMYISIENLKKLINDNTHKLNE